MKVPTRNNVPLLSFGDRDTHNADDLAPWGDATKSQIDIFVLKKVKGQPKTSGASYSYSNAFIPVTSQRNPYKNKFHRPEPAQEAKRSPFIRTDPAPIIEEQTLSSARNAASSGRTYDKQGQADITERTKAFDSKNASPLNAENSFLKSSVYG